MPIVNFNNNPSPGPNNALIPSTGTNEAPGTALKEITTIIKEFNNLIKSIGDNPVIGQMIQKRLGGGDQQPGNVIMSEPSAKQFKPRPEGITNIEPMDNQAMIDYFTTPGGLLKIAEGIEKIIPMVGDCKLSELKGLILEMADNKKEDQNKNGKNEN